MQSPAIKVFGDSSNLHQQQDQLRRKVVNEVKKEDKKEVKKEEETLKDHF